MRLLPPFILWGVLLALEPAAAQTPQSASARTAVFLDCHTHCDFDFFRREIAFVDWARDRADGDVHLLITSQGTGGGGDEYTLTFIGLRSFSGRSDTLQLTTRNTDVADEIRAAQVRVIKLGLIRFVAKSSAAPQISISYSAPPDSSTQKTSRDPWNYWTFNPELNGSVRGEQRNRFRSYRVGTEANRVTEALKITLDVSIRRSHSEVEIDDTTTFINDSRDYHGEGILVKSLGSHWSAGFVVNAITSTFRNLDFQLEGGPAMEYDIFPYSQSSRQRLTFRYTVGARYLNYEEPTIFDRLSESHPLHHLQISANWNQPWGNIFGSLGALQYLHDPSKHNISLFTGVEIRIVRGLTFNAFAEVERIKDQIFLPRGEASPEEIVAQRRQLGTDYSFSLEFGFGYRFGSKFNNVVNPRFGGD